MNEAVDAWLALGLDGGAPTAIDQIQWKQRSQVYRLRGFEDDNVSVIAKHCRTHMAVVERTVYEQVLSGLSVRSPTFLGYVDDSNSEPGDPFSWLFFEDIGARHFAPKDSDECRRFAKWLGAVQAAMLGFSTDVIPDLPLRDSLYYRTYLEKALVGAPAVAREREFSGRLAQLFLDVQASLVVVDQRWPDIAETFNKSPLTIVHGDCLPKNIHVICEPGEPVVPIDWGNAGWGLPGTDLGQSSILFGDDLIVAAETDVYAAQIGESWSGIDSEVIERWVNLGRLLWSIKVIAMSLPAFEHHSRRKTYEVLSLYAELLARSICSLGW